MENIGKFKREMKRAALKKIILLLVGVSSLFVLALLLAIYTKNESEAQNNLSTMKEVFVRAFEDHKNYLMDDQTTALYTAILTEGYHSQAFENSFYRFNLNRDISSEVIIVDTNWNLRYSSYPSSEITNNLFNHNNAVSYNTRNLNEDEVYTSVYDAGNNNYSNYMMVKPIFDEGTIIGYISLYLSGSDWSYYMSFYNNDGIITDNRDNVIFYNKPKLLQNSYKFEIADAKFATLAGDRYWVVYENLEAYNVQIYSLVYNPRNPEIMIGLLVIVIIGILWYRLAQQMADTMADKNARAINTLVQEIKIIRRHDQEHRIQMNTGDEFEDVGQQINHMLDTINELNIRNTELLKLNNLVEMKHLTAQLNPHLLYNTLEIIRNLVLSDKDKAEELIVQLTQVLRYSIDNTKRDVRLREDMEYIDYYLAIQKCRFDARFQCTVDLDAACYECLVPKLVLQPIIENSIKYGYMKKTDVHIEIKGFVQAGVLHLSVKDNGTGMSEEAAVKLNESLKDTVNSTRSNGLYNIARRLVLQYSEKSGLNVINQAGIGLEVRLRIAQTL